MIFAHGAVYSALHVAETSLGRSLGGNSKDGAPRDLKGLGLRDNAPPRDRDRPRMQYVSLGRTSANDEGSEECLNSLPIGVTSTRRMVGDPRRNASRG